MNNEIKANGNDFDVVDPLEDKKARLLTIQTELIRRGVKDVKFAWGDLTDATFDEVITDVIQALQAYLDGRVKPATMYDKPDVQN